MILGNRLTIFNTWLIGGDTGLPADRFFRVETLQNGVQRGAVREGEIGGDFKQRPEHKRTVFHVIVRNGEALGVNHLVAEKHNIEVERARSPAFGFTYATLL